MIALRLVAAEIKRSVKLVPPFIFGIILFLAVISAAVFLCTKLFSQESVFTKQLVAVAAPNDDGMLSGIISSVEKTDSVKEICEFRHTDEKTARELVRSGEAGCAIIIPENFIKSIVYGENTPARVIFTGDGSSDYSVTRELLDCGGKLLGNSQAGVYAFLDAYSETYGGAADRKTLFGVNLEYLSYVMTRNAVYEYETLSPMGELSVIQYFLASGCLVFMLLTGMICSRLFADNEAVIWHKLRIYGIGSIWRTVFKLLSVFLLMCTALAIFIGFMIVIQKIFLIELMEINLSVLTSLAAVAFCVSAFTVFVFQLTFSRAAGVLTLFVLSFGMIFMCGGFVPAPFLPQIFVKIGNFTPIRPMIDVLGTMFANKAPAFDGIFAWTAFFVLCAVIALKVRRV